MEFSSIEKMAIIFFLNKIMEADSIIDPREVSFLDEMYGRLAVKEEDISRLEMMDLEYSKSIISRLPVEKLQFAKESFAGMALSDDYYDPRERALIDSL